MIVDRQYHIVELSEVETKQYAGHINARERIYQRLADLADDGNEYTWLLMADDGRVLASCSSETGIEERT